MLTLATNQPSYADCNAVGLNRGQFGEVLSSNLNAFLISKSIRARPDIVRNRRYLVCLTRWNIDHGAVVAVGENLGGRHEVDGVCEWYQDGKGRLTGLNVHNWFTTNSANIYEAIHWASIPGYGPHTASHSP